MNKTDWLVWILAIVIVTAIVLAAFWPALTAEDQRSPLEQCLSYGYPEVESWGRLGRNPRVYCIKRTECTDLVVLLSDLKERE